MAWIAPVVNRTETEKGYYNAGDFNRIEGNTEQLAQTLTGYHYPVSVTSKTDWTRTDIPRLSETQRILGNVTAVRDAFFVKPDTPLLPGSMARIDYIKANAIEQIQADVHELIGNMEKSFIYCGTFYSGEGDL